MSDPALATTVSAFLRRTLELVADETRAIPEGWLALTPSLPEVWSLNGIWLDVEMSYEDAVSLCERNRGDRAFDRLRVSEAAGGSALEDNFRAAGWRVDVELESVLAHPPDREVGTTAVIEPAAEEALALYGRWVREDETVNLTPEAVGQLVECNRRTWPLRNVCRFGVRGPEGELVGMTCLFSDGRVAQVEDVYIAPEARGQGHGRAMVWAATSLASRSGHELTFIVADDNDWPKQLYAKLGFEPVSRTWVFHRDL